MRLALDMAGIEVKSLDPASEVLSVELLANRGDHRSYEGIVREAAALLRPLGANPVDALDVPLSDDHAWRNDERLLGEADPSLCLAYELLAFRLPGRFDPQWDADIVHLHELTGGDSDDHPVVAATNIVTAEIGQPLHAFDADTIEGPIRVRPSRAGEQILLLNHESATTLDGGIPVIADDAKVLAIAGVLGGQESSVTDATTSFLIESACFAPVEVRRGAQRLRVSTLASQRFERGGDPTAPRRGLRRLAALLERGGLGPSDHAVAVAARFEDAPFVIPFGAADANRLLASALSEEDVVEYLRWYGFARDGDGFRVPPWRRWDVREQADLIEEVAQAITYDNLPTAAPIIDSGALPTPEDELKDGVDEALSATGFIEVFGETFHDEAAAALLRGRRPSLDGDADPEHVRLVNSVDPRHGLLRRSAMVTAADIIRQNVHEGITSGRLYEWARVFWATSGDWGVEERDALWLAAFVEDGSAGDVFPLVRGAVEEAAYVTGLPLCIAPAAPEGRSAFHAHAAARILLHDVSVGAIGALAPEIADALGLERGAVAYAELDPKALLRGLSRPRAPVPRATPRTQAMRRMVSFRVPRRLYAGEVLEALAQRSLESPVAWQFDSEYYDEESRSITIRAEMDRNAWPSREAASEFVLSIARAVADELAIEIRA